MFECAHRQVCEEAYGVRASWKIFLLLAIKQVLQKEVIQVYTHDKTPANLTHTDLYSAQYGYNQPVRSAGGIVKNCTFRIHNHGKLCLLVHIENYT